MNNLEQTLVVLQSTLNNRKKTLLEQQRMVNRLETEVATLIREVSHRGGASQVDKLLNEAANMSIARLNDIMDGLSGTLKPL